MITIFTLIICIAIILASIMLTSNFFKYKKIKKSILPTVFIILGIILVLITEMSEIQRELIRATRRKACSDTEKHETIQSLDLFNYQFEPYGQTQTGSNIKVLIKRLIENANNYQNEEERLHIPEVYLVILDKDKASSEIERNITNDKIIENKIVISNQNIENYIEKLEKLKEEIYNRKKFAVYFDYDSINRIKTVAITDWFINNIEDYELFEKRKDEKKFEILDKEIEIPYALIAIYEISFIVYIIFVIRTEKEYKNKILPMIIVFFVGMTIVFIINIKEALTAYVEDSVTAKPIIYIYPEEETKMNVTLGKEDLITCIYPEYKENVGWNVLAKPNGDLVDLNTGRKLYSLYYESKSAISPKVEKEGFCVKGEDTAKFLEEKLEILGLNERETEEFIIYWLPQMEKNKYNYIRFLSQKEINANMPLEISETPDTLIRIVMSWKGSNKPINVEEQELEKIERTGFTVVEWGGTEIK